MRRSWFLGLLRRCDGGRGRERTGMRMEIDIVSKEDLSVSTLIIEIVTKGEGMLRYLV